MTRRKFLQSAALAAAATPLLPRGAPRPGRHNRPNSRATSTTASAAGATARSSWTTSALPARRWGLVAIDLLNPPDFETVKNMA